MFEYTQGKWYLMRSRHFWDSNNAKIYGFHVLINKENGSIYRMMYNEIDGQDNHVTEDGDDVYLYGTKRHESRYLWFCIVWTTT
jgi:hypothetical protein